ncbi:MAG: YdcF family protein, partial [Bacteroidales bacterium]|nr:YdcF family protein [Bacteroidales bacterium]
LNFFMLKRIFNLLKKIILGLLIFGGILLSIAVFFSYTVWPYRLEARLAAAKRFTPPDTEYIILLGGGGIPSETSLIRTYHAAYAAHLFPQAKVIIALPSDVSDSTSSIHLMAKELEMRGVNADRILFEDDGKNTRAQAIHIQELYFQDNLSAKLLVVTSPYHMLRAVSVFEKLGFETVGGYPAYEKANKKDSSFSPKKTGGNKYVPEINQQPGIRYSLWAGLQKEILVLREYSALAYYKLKGWI